MGLRLPKAKMLKDLFDDLGDATLIETTLTDKFVEVCMKTGSISSGLDRDNCSRDCAFWQACAEELLYCLPCT